MKLSDYLGTKGILPSHFAKALGVKASTVHRLLTGERAPSLEMVERIERVTGGKVRFHDWRSAA